MRTRSRRPRALLLDLDGTVYRGSAAVPGAPALLRRAYDSGIDLLYLTNRSSRTPEAVAEQLTSYGIPCNPDEVFTSAQATATYLPPASRVFVVGGEGLHLALREAGHQVSEDLDVDAVVVGFDPGLTYATLERAMRRIRGGARFIGTNGDRVMNTDGGLSPGNGAALAALVACTGREPEVCGKPELPFLDTALRRLRALPEQTLLIGDNLHTDVAGGRAAGIPTVLILTGVTSEAEAELVRGTSSAPDHLARDWDEVAEVVFGPRAAAAEERGQQRSP